MFRVEGLELRVRVCCCGFFVGAEACYQFGFCRVNAI